MPGRRAPEAERRQQLLASAFAVAARDGLDGLTVRAVAAEAGLSHGLVLFHFGSKEGLLHALLNWVLETTMVQPGENLAGTPPATRLLAAIDRETTELADRQAYTNLLFEFWVRGVTDELIRARIQTAMTAYRADLAPLAGDLIAASPSRLGDLTPADLATLAGQVILGFAIQQLVDPDPRRHARLQRTLTALLGTPETSEDRDEDDHDDNEHDDGDDDPEPGHAGDTGRFGHLFGDR